MSPRKPATLRTKWLGGHLKRLRDENGMTLAEVAEYLRRDMSQVSRFENGVVPVPQQDLESLLDLYGIAEEGFRTALLKLRAESSSPAWWDAFGAYAEADLIDMAWAESLAEGIRTFSAVTIDGLLQTPEYARAVMRAVDPDGPDEQIRRWVDLRIMRQAVLSRAQLSAIILEGVVRQQVGGKAIMAAQIRHLVAQASRPNVEIRLLPFAGGAHAGPEGAFRIYDMPDPLSEVVCVDGPAGVLYLEPPRSERLVGRYARLLDSALEPADSVERIAAIADELDEA